MSSPRVHAIIFVAALLGGCTRPETPVPVRLSIEHRVNGVPLDQYVLDTPFRNVAGNRFGVTRLVYFLSDVTLTPKDGAPAVAAGAHYVDHEEPATRTLEFALPRGAGAIESVSFTMGLPRTLNVSGAFSRAPESLMEWPAGMGGGYHYLKLEGRFIDDAGELVPFRVHSGALGGTDYSFPVKLDVAERSLAVSPADEVSLTLVMNLEQWFGGPNTWDLDQRFQPPTYGMMDSPENQRLLRENGASVSTLERR